MDTMHPTLFFCATAPFFLSPFFPPFYERLAIESIPVVLRRDFPTFFFSSSLLQRKLCYFSFQLPGALPALLFLAPYLSNPRESFG